MNTNNMPYEPLILPSNEIGWSDESFDLALRYVMHTTSLAEASDMQMWLRENIAKDIRWASANDLTHSLFKRPILLSFRSFEPSAMQNAYNEIKQNPRPRLSARNLQYHASNFLIIIIPIVVIAIVYFL